MRNNNSKILANAVKGDLTIDDIKSGIPLYHRPMNSGSGDALAIVKSLMKYGFSREYTSTNGGNMYGPGVYSVFDLKSTKDKAYGSIIVKLYLLGGLKGFLIWNKDKAMEVYGDEWRIEDQIRHLCPLDISNKLLRYRWGMGEYMGDRSAQYAKTFCDIIGRDIEKTQIRGFVFTGGHDGNVCVIRDFSDAIPYSYSTDGGHTWTVGITDELVYRAGHNIDVDARLRNMQTDKGKKMFDDIADRSINGYVIVYKRNKCNYYDVTTNKLISNVWFDFGSNFDENGNASVIYNGMTYTIYKGDGNKFFVQDADGFDICYLDDLPNAVNESKKPISINKGALRNMIFEAARAILEGKKLVDNFDKISNILEFNSPDDFYFVQIIKRFKDNPNDDTSVGNYHAGGWYIKSWRVRSVDELKNLKPEIIRICDANNARAYITVNNRSEKATNRQVIKVKAMYPKNDARSIHADEIVPGQAKHGDNWRGQRLRFFIDVDSADKRIHADVHKMLDYCNLKPIAEYESPSGGLHIILPNKEAPGVRDLRYMLTKLDNWISKGRHSTAAIEYDAKILLYSNVETKGY